MKLLIIEDAPNYIDFLKMELGSSRDMFEITAVESLADALASVQNEEYDAAILDLHLPDSYGIDTVLRLREKVPDLPIVILTGCQDEEVAVKAVQAGAQDYLLKDRLPHGMLARALQYAVQRQQTEKKLLESQEQLRQAAKIEAVGRLAGGVAHDFNNLLTVIMGYCSMLLAEMPNDEKYRPDVLEIKKTSERAAALTHQLLTFSRRRSLAAVKLDLNHAVADIEKMILRLMPANIEFTVKASSDTPAIQADPGQLAQVIVNLAVNARDAMPQGGRISVETKKETIGEDFLKRHPNAPTGYYAVLAVRDTGCGMSEDTLSHIFEPFFTTKDEGKGTGLGLSVVYGIVRQFGGEIEVASAPGRGTEFRIFFPAAGEASEDPKIAPPASAAVGGKETILLVEDEESVRQLTARILRERGYRVIEARHGEDALMVGRSQDGPIDLVIADVVMPKMSGWLVAQILRITDPGMKFLFVTGHDRDDVTLQAIAQNGAPILTKPFPAEALLAKVREVLQAPAIRRSDSAHATKINQGLPKPVSPGV